MPFVPESQLRRTKVDKFKISDDHQIAAFTVDIGNTENLTLGFKNLETNEILPFQIHNVGSCEFGLERTIYFTECDHYNRPCKVKRFNLDTQEKQTVFIDENPTHYIDIGVTKDKKFLTINSNTKEDGEIYVLRREAEATETTPKLLIKREPGVQNHIDHLRDFFVCITTDANKSYKLKKLKDASGSEWEDMLPFDDPTLVIDEFDTFDNFFALYAKRNGVPELIVQDLDTGKF